MAGCRTWCCTADVMWNVKRNRVLGCGIGCDHGQMWWNGAMSLSVKCGVMRDA